LRFHDLPGRQIRAPDVADPALADEVIERAKRLFDRRERIGRMELVEIDPVRLETPQAVPTADMM
jgi:hypothetical protein